MHSKIVSRNRMGQRYEAEVKAAADNCFVALWVQSFNAERDRQKALSK